MRLVRIALVLVALSLLGIGVKIALDGARVRHDEGVGQIVATAQQQREVLLTAAAMRPVATPTSVPTPTSAPTPTPKAVASPAGARTDTATATPAAQERVYEVQAGDTLSAIAARFGVSAEELARYNNLADPNALQVGQVLKLP